MSPLTLVAATGLSLVFGWAAVAKLRSQEQTAQGFAALHLPKPGTLARAVPGVELATAAALLVRPVWGAVVAFALLAGFTAFLADVVRRGIPVSCHCFGAGTERPVDRRTLYRNAVLLLTALAVVAFG
ncbi:MAG: hypothetical protein O3C27_01260 [Actinomycetota bacterium]|nr:hypothetical protein [Actinomycetota bacterium]